MKVQSMLQIPDGYAHWKTSATVLATRTAAILKEGFEPACVICKTVRSTCARHTMDQFTAEQGGEGRLGRRSLDRLLKRSRDLPKRVLSNRDAEMKESQGS